MILDHNDDDPNHEALATRCPTDVSAREVAVRVISNAGKGAALVAVGGPRAGDRPFLVEMFHRWAPA